LEGIQRAFESANKRTLIYSAKASPAYITLMCELGSTVHEVSYDYSNGW